MKIVQVCTSLNSFHGGAERFCLNLITALQHEAHDVILVTGDREIQDLDEMPNQIITIPESKHLIARKLLFDYFNPCSVTKFRRLLNDFNPDLVHFHSFYGLSSYLVRVAAHFCPVIVTLHDSWVAFYDSSVISLERTFSNTLWKTPLGYFHRKTNQLFFKDAVLVSPSMWMKQYFEEAGFKTPTYIPNGILDAGATTSYERVLLWVGSLTKFKGLPFVIDILSSHARHMGWRLVIVGDGPYRKVIQEQYPDVEFVGYSDPSPYYKIASLLVVSSLGYENLPTVILEAMQRGICVVGQDKGGISELIQHNKTGTLYNSKDSLAGHLSRLMRRPRDIRKLGGNAQIEFYRFYLWDSCYRKYLNIYRSLINGGQSRNVPIC